MKTFLCVVLALTSIYLSTAQWKQTIQSVGHSLPLLLVCRSLLCSREIVKILFWKRVSCSKRRKPNRSNRQWNLIWWSFKESLTTKTDIFFFFFGFVFILLILCVHNIFVIFLHDCKTGGLWCMFKSIHSSQK